MQPSYITGVRGSKRRQWTAGRNSDLGEIQMDVRTVGAAALLLAMANVTCASAQQTASGSRQPPATSSTQEPPARADASFAPLTWHGLTLYGAYDIGVGWVSHGLPENGYNYEGESLVNRNGNHSRFLIAPNNLSQTSLGLKGKEEFLPGWFAIFNASTGINPQSGDLANLAATNTLNAGRPPKRLFFCGRWRARWPGLQRRALRRPVVQSDRGVDLRSPAGARDRRHADVRSGRRRLLVLVHWL